MFHSYIFSRKCVGMFDASLCVVTCREARDAEKTFQPLSLKCRSRWSGATSYREEEEAVRASRHERFTAVNTSFFTENTVRYKIFSQQAGWDEK